MPEQHPIPRAPLPFLCEDERFASLDRAEAYFRGRQDDGKGYTWDGYLHIADADSLIHPGHAVPMAQRRPDARYDIGRMVVRRLTSLVFGQDHFPELRVEGDESAEDYVRTLASESRLSVRMAEARDLGGATGTACLSFGFVDGRPRVQVHNPKHVVVLQWADEDELRPAAVIKAFSYPKVEYDPESKKVVTRTYWKARFWDATREITWRDVPMDVAESSSWQAAPSTEIVHGYGFCPFYWIQNRPCSSTFDGEGDFTGCETTIDRINHLMSATTKGTIANVDPTLVVHMDPAMNNGELRKGSENAIFAPGGAEYLELKGTAVAAAERQIDRLVGGVLDVCGVVMADPDKLSGAAQSARALEILYAPMLANCDILREQYGEHGIKPLLVDMLRVSRRFKNDLATLDPETGEATKMSVTLPQRMERDENGVEQGFDREPGTSEQIVLNWRPYFSPTWNDINSAVNAAKAANGGKATISQRTSVQAVSVLFGVKDVDAEIEAIENEEEEALRHAAATFGPEPADSGALYDVDEEGADEGERESTPPEAEEPEPEAPSIGEEGVVENVQATALNGAQVQALVAIVKDVALGQLPADAAIEIVAASFQMTTADAKRILGSAGTGFKPRDLSAEPKAKE